MDIQDMAKRECKGQETEEEVDFLNSPENHANWLNSLINALNELDSQMTYHRDRISMMTEDVKLNIVDSEEYKFEKEKFDGWQRKALRYKAGLQRRITEVKTMMFGGNDNNSRAEVLANAIMIHKQQSELSGLDPESHDLELWSALAR